MFWFDFFFDHLKIQLGSIRPVDFFYYHFSKHLAIVIQIRMLLEAIEIKPPISISPGFASCLFVCLFMGGKGGDMVKYSKNTSSIHHQVVFCLFCLFVCLRLALGQVAQPPIFGNISFFLSCLFVCLLFLFFHILIRQCFALDCALVFPVIGLEADLKDAISQSVTIQGLNRD